MSTASESSESEHTLPRAELNPLLNPILAEHMGRWAEVYFTSPPEKREEAVLELLRELEAGNNGRAAAAPAAQGEPKQATPTFSRVEETKGVSTARMHPPSVRCQRCGHDNPVTHQFCGMCGASVTGAAPESFRTDSPYEQHAGEMESVPAARVPAPAYEAVHEPEVDEPPPAHYARRSDPYDLSMLQRLREREINDYRYEERSSPPYRYYIAAVLAILLVVLGYMAWRSGQAPPESRQASAPPPPAATENTPPPASSPAVAPTAAPSNPPKATVPAASVSGNGAVEAPKPQPTENASTKPQGAGTHPPASAVPTIAPAEPPFTDGSGSEELATAQRYLTGNNGKGRNSAEAAKWLWKAMAKHNGPATLQLADLYLKGDGVPKNCDQARVLLDSAALRGMKGAAERLRNLQAFGCQ